MVRRQLLAVALAALATVVIAQPGSGVRGREGGILKISFSTGFPLDYLDPALAFAPTSWSLLDATCARLYSYPDKPSPASFRPEPEVAAGYTRSADMKTYTFTLRDGFRFSDGTPVRANAFQRAINRVLQPAADSVGTIFMRDIVGADDVVAGRKKTARGVIARGNTLVVRFKRPAPDFVARTTFPFFCAVPPWLPGSAEGLGAIPSAGPYYVKEYRPREGVVIRRNPYYGGDRKVHLAGFNVNLRGGNVVEMLRGVERGDADWGYMPAGIYAASGLAAEFEKKYGRNKSRYWVRPGLTLRVIAFNSSGPLFRDNPRLRRAVNFALDRRALESTYGHVITSATDQLVPYSVPGFRDAHVYPLQGNLARARELAHGHLRHAKAVIRVNNLAPLVETAQSLQKQLAKIGLEVEIIKRPEGAATGPYLQELTGAEAEWDLAYVLWLPNIPDAHTYLSLFLKPQLHGGEALTRVRATAALAQAARLPRGRARDLAYAKVDKMIARDVAPVAVLSVLNEATIVSERVGCMVLRPVLDLAVACLKN